MRTHSSGLIAHWTRSLSLGPLVTLGALCAVSACEPDETPACGNGIVETGEICDDGNTLSGDGCSDTCQPDDNLATPGDDRAGYIACIVSAGHAPLTCSPGTGCCNNNGATGNTTCTTAETCPVLLNFNDCDGPEDCPAGQRCFIDRYIYCGTSGLGALCHTDADCAVFADRPYCSGYFCSANPSDATQASARGR